MSRFNYKTAWRHCSQPGEETHLLSPEAIYSDGLNELSLRELIRGDNVGVLGMQAVSLPGEGHDSPLHLLHIGAEDDLPLTVSPQSNNSRGWFFLYCLADGGEIVDGLNPNVVQHKFVSMVMEKAPLSKVLKVNKARQGDSYFLQSGKVFGTLKAECLLLYCPFAEFVQVDMSGSSSDEVLASLKGVQLSDRSSSIMPADMSAVNRNKKQDLARCRQFVVEKIWIKESFCVATDNKSFHLLHILEGQGNFQLQFGAEKRSFSAGETVLIPATCAEYRLERDGDAILKLLRFSLFVQ